MAGCLSQPVSIWVSFLMRSREGEGQLGQGLPCSLKSYIEDHLLWDSAKQRIGQIGTILTETGPGHGESNGSGIGQEKQRKNRKHPPKVMG